MSEYASYLSNLQDKASVIATEDILSDKGMLIAKSGVELNGNAYENILKFKLLKPLEDSIAISNQLNAKSIYNHIIQFIARDPCIQSIDNKLGEKSVLQRCCLQAEKYNLLMQKLTVLNMEVPEVFNQTVLAAYLAYICALTDRLNQEDINHYFLAGLSHDIGFLHIDRNILLKKETLTAQEWRKIQAHPVIGYEILKRMEKFPKIVSQAVLEHHENLDGTGYPRAKTSKDLGSLGQVISLIDNVIAIYNKKFKPLNRSLRDIMPIIQVNMHSYFPDAISVILRTLKQAPKTDLQKSNKDIFQALLTHVEQENIYINRIIHNIRKNNEALGYSHNHKEIYAIQNIATNITMIARSAGLSDENYTTWLKEINPDNIEESNMAKVYSEIEDARVMIDELAFQIQNYMKAASVFTSKNPTHALYKTVETVIESFSAIHRPSAPKILKQHWQTISQTIANT